MNVAFDARVVSVEDSLANARHLIDAVAVPLDSAIIVIGHQVCLSSPGVCTEQIKEQGY